MGLDMYAVSFDELPFEEDFSTNATELKELSNENKVVYYDSWW